jgi:hypothetical protein
LVLATSRISELRETLFDGVGTEDTVYLVCDRETLVHERVTDRLDGLG